MFKLSKGEARTADIIDILDQKRWWKSTGSAVVRRRDLHINHKLNIMAKLLREAQETAFAYALKPVFTTAPDCVSAELDRMMREPEKWMVGTVMFRALLQDVMAFAEVTPEDIGMESMLMRPSMSYSGALIPTDSFTDAVRLWRWR